MPVLTNLLPTPADWNLDETVHVDGSLMTFYPDWAMASVLLPQAIANHIYYGRVWQRRPSNSTEMTDGRFEYYMTDEADALMVFTSFFDSPSDGEWRLMSNCLSLPAPRTGQWMMRNFLIHHNAAAQRKEPMLIDLTEAFGAGNEPSKEWCDGNIPYFTGSHNLIQGVMEIKYGSSVISSSNESAAPRIFYGNEYLTSVPYNRTINCSNRIMLHDLKIGSKTLHCASRKMLSNIVIRSGLTPHHWQKYYWGYQWTFRGSVSKQTTNTTRVGEMIAVSDIDAITMSRFGSVSVPIVAGEHNVVISEHRPIFDFDGHQSWVIHGDMPTSLSGYSGYYVASNADTIKTGGGQSFTSEYVATVTGFTNLYIAYMWTANIRSYEKVDETKYPGAYIETVESSNRNAYPDNGIQDGYWWIKID